LRCLLIAASEDVSGYDLDVERVYVYRQKPVARYVVDVVVNDARYARYVDVGERVR